MRTKVKLWMLPLGLILSFTLTTCVVAAFADSHYQFEPTQCFFATNVYTRMLDNGTDRETEYIMEYGLMVYRDQVAPDDWNHPDLFVCTRR